MRERDENGLDSPRPPFNWELIIGAVVAAALVSAIVLALMVSLWRFEAMLENLPFMTAQFIEQAKRLHEKEGSEAALLYVEERIDDYEALIVRHPRQEGLFRKEIARLSDFLRTLQSNKPPPAAVP